MMEKKINYKAVGSINAANVRAFKEELMIAVNSAPESTILVDLEDVDFLDSSGLMAFVTAYKTAQNKGKRLRICSVSPSVRIIFELSQLDRVFDLFETDLNESLAA
jgi:anti-anti-sigma factor